MAEFVRSSQPASEWMPPADLASNRYEMAAGKILMGRQKSGRLVGIADNRHVVTVAGSRAGKSATSLLSNLHLWDGSAFVIDPKGELASESALHRAKMGQDVFILDPFGEVKGEAAKLRVTYNPLNELAAGDADTVIDDAAEIADAVILGSGAQQDHWTLAAKNLIRGLILWTLHSVGKDKGSLNDVRYMLTSPLGNADAKKDANGERMSLAHHFRLMAKSADAFGGAMAGVGSTMLGKPENERGSIISTAVEQTGFLDSIPMKTHLETKGLETLRVLKRKPSTIYLVLPASRMATHFRWLRLVLILALNALEREENRTGRDVLFILEEFPTLGYMRQIEAAAGLMAGYDVKLWTVMQDLTQIKAHYPNSWETFIGNAGMIEAFGNTDATTLDYLSRQLGNTLAVQAQPERLTMDARQKGEMGERETIVSVPLMATHEIAQGFARDKKNKLVMLAGEKPFSIGRVFWKDLADGET